MAELYRLPQFDTPDHIEHQDRDFDVTMQRMNKQEGEEGEEELIVPDLLPLPFKTSNDHVYFKVNIFIKECLYHMLFPLSLPVVLWLEGVAYARNRYFLPKRFKNHKFNGNEAFWRETTFNVSIVLMVLYWFFSPNELDRLTKYEIGIVITMAYVRYIIIATKYAYMSFGYYNMLSTKVVTRYEGRNGLLIPWWAPPTELLIAHWKQRVTCKHIKLDGTVSFNREQLQSVRNSFELAESVTNGLVFNETTGTYNVLNRERMASVLDVSGSLKQSLISDKHVIRPVFINTLDLGIHEDKNTFSAAYLSWQIILDSCDKVTGWYNPFKVGATIGIVHICIPYVVRAFFGQPLMGDTWIDVVIQSIAMFLTLTMFVTNMAFMQVGAMDLWRRYFYQLQLDTIVSRGYYPGTFSMSTAERLTMADQQDVDGFVLDMTDPYNITVWMETRELLRTFGIGFYKRICAITAYYALFGAIEVFVLLLSVFGTDINKVDVSFWAVTAAVFWDAVIISIAVVAMAYPAALANGMGKHHREHLLRHKLRIENYLSMFGDKLDDEKKKTLQECCRLLHTCQHKIQVDDDLNPIRILGVRADPTMYRTLATIVLSAISAVGRVLGFV
eukprot:TRINITY_DN5397_c0_g1_i1.p1 TRINITY_DN5397_c0_g1~~TRINITY_DN5397_c0_g1_i1.p1  ORF type:complete len:614 (+),score=184.74 TRINITY_DN5397_c0_g1_i1:99-1940(+)